MKVLHVSDNHGHYWKACPPDVNVVVHSGDFMPNRTRGIVPIEVHYQEGWVSKSCDQLKLIIGNRPFLFVPGNHDYIDPCPIMRAAGIDARNLHVEGPASIVVGEETWNFHGFPYIPYFTGEWNFELGHGQMAAEFEKIPLDTADILVCHAPMYGVMDRNITGIRCGSTEIRNRMMWAERLPIAYLHGHIHEANGLMNDWKGMIVSNAATRLDGRVLTLTKRRETTNNSPSEGV